MRALVTGAGGFVGRHLVSHLLESADSVLATDLKSPSIEKCENVALDVTDFKAVTQCVNRFKPEVIFHLAGIAFVPLAEEDFERVLKINVGGTANIYRTSYLIQSNIKVIFVSSAEVYGQVRPTDLPVSETTEVRPSNNYSLTKAMAELVAGRYEANISIRSVVVRPFNHIGPGQSDLFVASSFARQLALIKLGKIAPVIKVGILAAKRDFTDVRDIVRAYRLAAIQGAGTYNLASGKSIAIQEILDTLVSISGLNITVEQDAARMRPADVAEIYGNFTKAEADLGWKPVVPLTRTLTDLFADWVRKESVAT